MTGKVLLIIGGVGLIALLVIIIVRPIRWVEPSPTEEYVEVMKLPKPELPGAVSVEEALLRRRSVRDYADDPLTLQEVSQLLWAAQGETDPRGFRTAPSAGALYPLELYLVAARVEGLSPGVYKYWPAQHELALVAVGDVCGELATAALGQSFVRRAPINLVFSAVYERTTKKYGHRGRQYVHMEVGHAAQNVYLQVVSLKLGTVVVGAFHDDAVKRVLSLPDDEEPLYIMPVGKVRTP